MTAPAEREQEAPAPEISDERRLAKICRDHEECAEAGCDVGVVVRALASCEAEVRRKDEQIAAMMAALKREAAIFQTGDQRRIMLSHLISDFERGVYNVRGES